MISEPLAEASDLRVGTAVTLRILTVDQIARIGSGVGDPQGPDPADVGGRDRADAGLGRSALGRAGEPRVRRRYADTASSHPAFVRLDDTPGAADAFAKAYASAAAAAPPSVLAAYLPPQVFRPRADGDPAARAAERTLIVGLTIFAAVLASGRAAGRRAGVAAPPRGAARRRRTSSGRWGMTPAERVAARLGAAGPAAVVAAVLAGALGMAAGTLQPLGSQARFEPEPGFRAPWEVADRRGARDRARVLRTGGGGRGGRRTPGGPDDAPRSPARDRRGPGWGRRRSSGCASPCAATVGRSPCPRGPPWRWRASSRRSRSGRASRCCCRIPCGPARPPTSRWRTPRSPTSPSSSSTRGWRRWRSRARSRPYWPTAACCRCRRARRARGWCPPVSSAGGCPTARPRSRSARGSPRSAA